MVDSPSIEVALPETKKDDSKKTASTSQKRPSIPFLSDHFVIDEIQMDFPKIVIKSGKTSNQISLAVHGTKAVESQPYHFTMDFGTTLEKDPKKVTVNLTSDIDSKIDLTGKLTAYVGTPGKKPRIDLTSDVKADLFKQQGELAGKIVALYPVEIIPRLEVNQFKIAKTDKLTASGDFNIDFLIGSLNNPRKSALPPPKFKTQFSGRIEAQQSEDKPIEFNLNINPLEQYGIKLAAHTKGTYDTKHALLGLDSFLVSMNIEFQKTVAGLRMTQLAIPAPLDEMTGNIDLKIGDEKIAKAEKQTFTIPVSFQTNLKSKTQSLVTSTKGSLVMTPIPFKGDLKLDVALNDIAIQSPAFDPISSVPTVVADQRFVSTQKDVKKDQLFEDNQKKDEPSNFTTEINITTPDKPIRVLYKLFKPAAVFRVQSEIGKSTPNYKVSFEPFEVSYFKRTAKLEKLVISNDEEAKSILLDGRFTMKKADYNIFADVHQEAKNTTISLSSDPPLSEDDIISLILFNELSSELDSTSTDSVANTNAAMTKKTIGFLSFFVLASTPVESVNYDSSTNQYSARVKLPGGFTGTVGSDFDKTQEVGLRRRLGGQFVIKVGYGTNALGETTQDSMVEWYHRY